MKNCGKGDSFKSMFIGAQYVIRDNNNIGDRVFICYWDQLRLLL